MMRWLKLGLIIFLAILAIYLARKDSEVSSVPEMQQEEENEEQATTTPASSKATEEQVRGILEKATDTRVRPLLSLLEINRFLPERGGFVFPSPYNTRAARITNASDCGNTDCVNYIGYSFWMNMNNHVGRENILIFLGLKHDYGGPTLFSLNKTTFEVTKLGPLFPESSPYSWHTADGWYWSWGKSDVLYVWQPEDSKLSRYNVASKSFETVFDISAREDLFGTNTYIWQMSSSADDTVHAATIKERKDYQDLGCMVYSERSKEFKYFKSRVVEFDECQIDKSGRFLVIKEKLEEDSESQYDNRIIDLVSNREIILLDKDGAGGHSDLGFGYYVAADNWNQVPNAIRLWKLGTNPLGPGRIVYSDPEWLPGSADHISFANAKQDVAIEKQYACASGADRENGPRVNEIICFKLDGSKQVLVVAPVMTNMNAALHRDEYAKMPKGNLDVTGRYFIWTTNLGGNRLDAVIVEIPVERLM